MVRFLNKVEIFFFIKIKDVLIVVSYCYIFDLIKNNYYYFLRNEIKIWLNIIFFFLLNNYYDYLDFESIYRK